MTRPAPAPTGPPCIPDHSVPTPCPGCAEDPRRPRITAALTAEWYRRVEDQIVATPEEHCAALATVAIAALDEQKGH